MAAAPLFQGNPFAFKGINKPKELSQILQPAGAEEDPSNEAMKPFSLPKPQLGFSSDMPGSTIFSESSELSLNLSGN